MADNLALWNKLGRTDPDQTKGFKRAGGFTGTAIKPIYTTRKMTEVFGPAGRGWGMGEPTFQIVPGHNGEVMVYCTVKLWWTDDDGQCGEVYGVGGDKVVSHIKANEQYNRPERWENDDEAFKKAFTDAVGNAMKHLGMSADVHMGRFDDSKYIASVRSELREQLEASTREPDGIDVSLEGEAPAKKGKYKYGDKRVEDMRPIWGEMRDELDRATSLKELSETWFAPAFQAELKNMPPGWQRTLLEHKEAAKAIFLKALPDAADIGTHLDNLDAQGAGGPQ